MQIRINQIPYELSDDTSLALAIEAGGFKPPFAVAVNMQFVPKSQYAATPLHDGDHIEVISPITGG